MGLYQKYILPWLVHLVMQNAEAERLRARAVPAARGRVLEIGIGSGLNLPYYGAAVEGVAGVDPSPRLLGMAERAAAECAFGVDLVEGGAEDLPFDSWSFDSVVSTWTLCSVGDPARALAEIRRVLKPDGRFIFVEHGLSREAGVRRWQHRLTPYWRRCAGGCHLDRDIDALVGGAGFRVEHLDMGYLVRGPRVLSWHYEGCAR